MPESELVNAKAIAILQMIEVLDLSIPELQDIWDGIFVLIEDKNNSEILENMERSDHNTLSEGLITELTF